MTWSILYRGPLSSCNYDCVYCPFAKTKNTIEELEDDRRKLERFTQWLSQLRRSIQILFTPWGEALHHKYYQQALCHISHLAHVKRVAIQTNLAAKLDWLEQSDNNTLAFWATFHPTQVKRSKFLKRVDQVLANGNRISVGVVGVKNHFEQIKALRTELPSTVYLWINAYKRDPSYYAPADLSFLEDVDPNLPLNDCYYPSRSENC